MGRSLHAEAELDPGSEEAPGTQLTGSSPGSQVVFRVCCEPERSLCRSHISVPSRLQTRMEQARLQMPCRSGKHCGLTEKSCLPGGSGVYFAAALLPSRLALDVSGFGRRVLHTVVRVLRSLGRLESGVRFWGGARALQVNVRTGKSTFDFPDGWVKMKPLAPGFHRDLRGFPFSSHFPLDFRRRSRSNGATYYWNPKTGASQPAPQNPSLLRDGGHGEMERKVRQLHSSHRLLAVGVGVCVCNHAFRSPKSLDCVPLQLSCNSRWYSGFPVSCTCDRM